MDFLVADDKRMEQGFLPLSKTVDVDLGNTNDFEITLGLKDFDISTYNFGFLVYANGTEYGGIIEDIKPDTKSNNVKLKGHTWRGLLTQKIIEPPSGLPYLTVSGEANAVIESVIDGCLGDWFVVSAADSGFTVNYQFNRYVTLLDGLTDMLAEVGARLKIYYDNTDKCVHIEAVAITDLSSTLEYSQDHKLNFIARDSRMGINHLICLGSGELTARTVVNLYVQEDGTIGSTKYYTGINERVATLDYPNAETVDDLTASGINKLKELMNYQELSMTVGEIAAELGDIVGGRERITGLQMTKPITNKILRVTGNKETISFKVGD